MEGIAASMAVAVHSCDLDVLCHNGPRAVGDLSWQDVGRGGWHQCAGKRLALGIGGLLVSVWGGIFGFHAYCAENLPEGEGYDSGDAAFSSDFLGMCLENYC